MPIEKILWVKHKSLKVAPDTDKGDDMRTLFIFLLAFVTSTINAQCPDDRHPHLIDLGLPSVRCGLVVIWEQTTLMVLVIISAETSPQKISKNC